MAFHHDILRFRETPDDEWDWVEVEYSLQECIDLGWYDLETRTWLRKTIEIPDKDGEYPGLPRPDSEYGKTF